MAQYYQLIGQNEPPIQAVTIEELRQYYPNITCVEATNGIQYVINQDEATTQFQSQQVTFNSVLISYSFAKILSIDIVLSVILFTFVLLCNCNFYE